jgi:uncharacterized hydrophobic protein (TIGR00271 family)
MNLLRTILRLIDLRGELEDYDAIHLNIEQGVAFKGTNLWVLVFAIVVASVGLNTNSTAVIIGAMLISPLMGPINGVGYSIATYNFALFRSAIKNLTFAVAASLIASTLYFAVSPVSTAQSELLARTSPTIYDVLIALFGGLAGIVGISSKHKGNALPGVAIATALMPPLCTAGYGLATAQFNFFFGAFYLFTINAVFIALAATIVSQILKFPIRGTIAPERKTRINQIISAVILVTLLPSLFFGYKLVQNERFTERANKFVQNVTVVEGSYLLKHEITAHNRSVRLIYGGMGLSDTSKRVIRRRAADFDLADAVIEIEQGFSLERTSKSETETLKTRLNAAQASLQSAEKTIDSLKTRHRLGKSLFRELRALYPQTLSCAYSEIVAYSDSAALSPVPLIVVTYSGKPRRLTKENQEHIERWLAVRLQRAAVQTVFIEE